MGLFGIIGDIRDAIVDTALLPINIAESIIKLDKSPTTKRVKNIFEDLDKAIEEALKLED